MRMTRKGFPSPFGESFRKYRWACITYHHLLRFPSPFGESFRKLKGVKTMKWKARGFRPLSGNHLENEVK